MHRINREDMLELTRRMTLKRNCFGRIAGAYLDGDGFVEDTFHTHFQKLQPSEQTQKLAIAKQIPFGETNVKLKEYLFSTEDEKPGSVWQMLMALKDCELKNDALLDVLYEKIGECYRASGDYGIYFFQGSYDVPLKAQDKESLWESEEVYKFLICAICPIYGDYEPGDPECGFLFPAFTDRSANIHGIDVYQRDERHPHEELEKQILGVRNSD